MVLVLICDIVNSLYLFCILQLWHLLEYLFWLFLFFFLLLITIHNIIGIVYIEEIVVVDEWLVLFLQVGNRALLHLERHQLVNFWQIDKARLAYIEIARKVSIGVRTQQVSSSPTEIANQTR